MEHVHISRESVILSKRRSFSRTVVPYLLVAPIVIWVLWTIVLPLGIAVRDSFLSNGIIGMTGPFVGLKNFRTELASGGFWNATVRSLIWVIGNAFIQSILAFGAAILLQGKAGWFKKLSRVWIIIPWVIPTIDVIIFWKWILNATFGPVNYVLLKLHLISTPMDFLGSPGWATFSTILINSWHWFPFMAIIIFAAMQSIDTSMYEAADIDGASSWQQFWSITFPSLGRTLFALGLVGTMWSFNIYDVIQLLTNGGPNQETDTLPLYIHDLAFQAMNESRASAAAVISAVILVVFALLYLKFAAPKDKN